MRLGQPHKKKTKKTLLTFQTRDLDQEIEIIAQGKKTNYETQFSINSLLNDEIEKIFNLRKEHNKTT